MPIKSEGVVDLLRFCQSRTGPLIGHRLLGIPFDRVTEILAGA